MSMRPVSQQRPATVGAVTSKPTEPPSDGEATEVTPHGEKVRPTVTVYTWPRPALWVYWRGSWEYADVRARHDWPTGAVAYQVEVTGTSDDGTRSRFTRTFLWGPDSIRAADD